MQPYKRNMPITACKSLVFFSWGGKKKKVQLDPLILASVQIHVRSSVQTKEHRTLSSQERQSAASSAAQNIIAAALSQTSHSVLIITVCASLIR